MFSEAKNIEINGKTVKSIVNENGGILYQRENGSSYPVINNIVLTSDKSVLSAYDGESAVLTATVTGENVDGLEVEFFNGTTSLGTSVITNGVATKSYTATGVGDINVSAKYEETTSNTVTIEDCIFYSTTETECTPSNNYITVADLSNLTLPNAFELTFDYKTNAEARCGLFNKTTFTGNPNYSVFIGSPNGSKWYYGYRTTSTNTTDISNSPTSYSTYVISRNGNTFSYKKDSSSTYTKSVSWFNSYNYVFGLMGWGTSLASSVKNIKLKAL